MSERNVERPPGAAKMLRSAKEYAASKHHCQEIRNVARNLFNQAVAQFVLKAWLMHRPAELHGVNQADQVLIGTYCNAGGRRVRDGVAGVAIALALFDSKREVPDAGDTRERNTFINAERKKFYAISIANNLSRPKAIVADEPQLLNAQIVIHKVIHRICGYQFDMVLREFPA